MHILLWFQGRDLVEQQLNRSRWNWQLFPLLRLIVGVFCIGWDLVWNILKKLAPHLGGTYSNIYDIISALSIIPGESLPKFYNHALDLQNTTLYSKAAVPPTRLIACFIDQLMTCAEIRLFLAHKKSLLNEHIQMFGENIKTPLDSMQMIFDHLDA
jgi:hypothetical protein